VKFFIWPLEWYLVRSRGQLKCDGTRVETIFRLSAKRTSPFKSARGASVQSTTGSRGVRISGGNAGYTMFRGSVKSTGYLVHSPVSPSLPLPFVTMFRGSVKSTGYLHSPVSPSLPLPFVTVCHHISTGVLRSFMFRFNRCVKLLTKWQMNCSVFENKLEMVFSCY